MEPISAGISLIPSFFKLFSGIGQANRAKRIKPTDPGYVMNQGVINNARTLDDRYTNYSMPGYNVAKNNISSAAAAAFGGGMQGASSGGDVLDLASKIAYGQGQNYNKLATQNAQGKDAALMQSLQAQAQAGQQYVNKNAWDRDMYQRKLAEKAALTQTGNQNIYGSLEDAGIIGSRAFSNKGIIKNNKPLLSDIDKFNLFSSMNLSKL